MPSFLKELRRRNVIKVGLAYLALEWLERAFEQSDPNTPYLRVPEFDALHSDPRVRELIRRLGI